jgi:hypothetical protein
VINWIGHDIVVGSVVFRGGRQGDSSSFRVGVVDDIDESKPKPVLVTLLLDHISLQLHERDTAFTTL